MDFVKLKRMRSLAHKYVFSFDSVPSGASKSRLLSQLNMLEELLLEEKENIEDSSLGTDDINNLIKQKSKLESVLQSFTPKDIKRDQKKIFQKALDDFGYELRVSEMKLRGIEVDPSKFREERKKRDKESEKGEKLENLPIELQKAGVQE